MKISRILFVQLSALLLCFRRPVVHGKICDTCFQFRSASGDDIPRVRKILIQQVMNPLFIKQENFLIAYDESQQGNPLIGFGQIRPLESSSFSELASLYVLPEYRHQGVGRALVEALIERHKSSPLSSNRLCLLTLKPTSRFYRPFGFRVASEMDRKQLPLTLQFEFQAGNLLSRVWGRDVVCMVQ